MAIIVLNLSTFYETARSRDYWVTADLTLILLLYSAFLYIPRAPCRVYLLIFSVSDGKFFGQFFIDKS